MNSIIDNPTRCSVQRSRERWGSDVTCTPGCLVCSIYGFVTVTERVSEGTRIVFLILSDPPNDGRNTRQTTFQRSWFFSIRPSVFGAISLFHIFADITKNKKKKYSAHRVTVNLVKLLYVRNLSAVTLNMSASASGNKEKMSEPHLSLQYTHSRLSTPLFASYISLKPFAPEAGAVSPSLISRMPQAW